MTSLANSITDEEVIESLCAENKFLVADNELLKAECDAMAAESDWQTIDSAKRDKDERNNILLYGYNMDGSRRVGEGYCTVDEWEGYYKENWFWANDSCCCCHYSMNKTPTHWKPLDAPLPEDSK